MEGYAITKAKREDCKAIHKLIQELADYENMPNGPQLDVDTLERDGFGSRPVFSAFIASTQDGNRLGNVVGYAIYYFTYSTWQGKSIYLEDIYVQEKHRKKGVGLSLLRHVAVEASNENCLRLNFSVLDWNKPSIDFYKSLGAVDLTEQEGWHCFRLTRQAIDQLAQIARGNEATCDQN